MLTRFFFDRPASFFDDDDFFLLPISRDRTRRATYGPALTLTKADNEFQIKGTLGEKVDPKDIKIKIDKDKKSVTVEWAHTDKHEEKDEEGNVLVSRVSTSSYTRHFHIPDGDFSDESKISAEVEQGSIVIGIPALPEEKKEEGEDKKTKLSINFE